MELELTSEVPVEEESDCSVVVFNESSNILPLAPVKDAVEVSIFISSLVVVHWSPLNAPPIPWKTLLEFDDGPKVTEEEESARWCIDPWALLLEVMVLVTPTETELEVPTE